MLVNSIVIFIVSIIFTRLANCTLVATTSIISPQEEFNDPTTVQSFGLITLSPQANGLAKYQQLEKRKKKSTSFTVNPTAVAGAVVTDASYVDIYQCNPKSMNVTQVEDIGKASYGCSNEAMVSYLINRGEAAVTNLTFIVNKNSTYVKYYNAYIREVQSSIMLQFGEWFQNTNGAQYYTCADKKSCEKDHKHIFQKHRSYKYTDMYIDDANWDAALKSMSAFLNITLTKDDFTKGNGISYNISHVAFDNCTIPKAAVIVPNPMESVTTENITNLANLIETAKQSLGKAAPLDLLEYLIPVISYSTVSNHAMQMYNEGKKEVAYEKKERELKILEIVFACIGIASIAFGPLVAGIVGSVIAFADVFASWGITGKFSVNMLVTALVSVIFVEFSFLEVGAEISEVVNCVRSDIGSVFGHLVNFPEWTEPMQQMFSLTFQTGVSTAVSEIPN